MPAQKIRFFGRTADIVNGNKVKTDPPLVAAPLDTAIGNR